jgi:multicomponent K+:H+ antiporter subunit E
MKRRARHLSPTLVLSLTAAWLLLNQTLAPAQIVLGAGLAIALAWAGSTFRPLRAHVRRPDIAAGLVLVVLLDIVRSNISVARIVLGLRRDHKVASGFLHIPLELHDPYGLAALAAIITSTPGTVWAGISADGNTLTLHVLDLRNEAELIHAIKHRYEAPLRKIFE